ncbi:hypothetical protein H8N03_01035 [Ramlibacter sp. USB13]|uniref:Uncharacterized protein n=1 Tax=Ramlibacter cellulosilyticus TaxID=2764187 RepID=A0A923MMJ2_9BURK|nr:hypothetical protein [Ramlibacter cellulosilyticus]MBC5781506.1 hypothetical protein [Ramlibacter cellulosilyticus]
MFKLLALVLLAVPLYFGGKLAYERYTFVSRARAWLAEAEDPRCRPEDLARLLQRVERDLRDDMKPAAGPAPADRLAAMQFAVRPFRAPEVVGITPQRLCTEAHFPWKPSKGMPTILHCTMPKYVRCETEVTVTVPADILRDAEMTARYGGRGYVPGSPPAGLDAAGNAVFRFPAIHAALFEHYRNSNAYVHDRQERIPFHEVQHFGGGVRATLANWSYFHQNRARIEHLQLVSEDIGGAVTGGGYAGGIRKMREEQLSSSPPPPR